MKRARVIVTVVVLGGACLLCMLPQYPMWMTNQQHAKQAECRRSLRAVMDAFVSAADAGTTKPTPRELAKHIPSERRWPYTYVLAADVTVAPTRDAPGAEELSRQLKLVTDNVHPGLSESGALTIACVANTDEDDEVDLLSVSSVERYVFGDIPVRALEIELQANDFPGEAPKAVTFVPKMK